MLVSRSPQVSTEQRVAPGGPSLPTDGHGPAHSGKPATGLSDLLSLWAPRGRRPPPGSWEATCDSSPAESAAALQQMSPSRSSDGDWERVEGPAPDQQRAGPHRRPPPPRLGQRQRLRQLLCVHVGSSYSVETSGSGSRCWRVGLQGNAAAGSSRRACFACLHPACREARAGLG